MNAEPSPSPFKGKTGVRRLINAVGYSLDGLKAAWQFESAFRQVALLAVLGVGLAMWLRLDALSFLMIVMCHALCLVVELFNSAIEAAVDHTSLERNPLAKRAKDLGSAAQMVALCLLAAVWGGLVVWPYWSRLA